MNIDQGTLHREFLTSCYYDFQDVAFQRYLKENPKTKKSKFKKNDQIQSFFKKAKIGDKLEWYIWDDMLLPNSGFQLVRGNEIFSRIAFLSLL